MLNYYKANEVSNKVAEAIKKEKEKMMMEIVKLRFESRILKKGVIIQNNRYEVR